jgi:hypothetical protein
MNSSLFQVEFQGHRPYICLCTSPTFIHLCCITFSVASTFARKMLYIYNASNQAYIYSPNYIKHVTQRICNHAWILILLQTGLVVSHSCMHVNCEAMHYVYPAFYLHACILINSFSHSINLSVNTSVQRNKDIN